MSVSILKTRCIFKMPLVKQLTPRLYRATILLDPLGAYLIRNKPCTTRLDSTSDSRNKNALCHYNLVFIRHIVVEHGLVLSVNATP